jgi:hypothetical protein
VHVELVPRRREAVAIPGRGTAVAAAVCNKDLRPDHIDQVERVQVVEIAWEKRCQRRHQKQEENRRGRMGVDQLDKEWVRVWRIDRANWQVQKSFVGTVFGGNMFYV